MKFFVRKAATPPPPGEPTMPEPEPESATTTTTIGPVPGRDISISMGSMSLTEQNEMDWFNRLVELLLQEMHAGDRFVVEFRSSSETER